MTTKSTIEPDDESDKPDQLVQCRRRLAWQIISSVLLLIVFVSQVDDRMHALEYTVHFRNTRVGLLREHGMIALGGYHTTIYSNSYKFFPKYGDYYHMAYLLDGKPSVRDGRSCLILPGIRYHHYDYQSQNSLWFITVWHPLVTLLATGFWGWTFYRYHRARYQPPPIADEQTFRFATWERAKHWLSRPGKHLKAKFWLCLILTACAFINLLHDLEWTLVGVYDFPARRVLISRTCGTLSFGYVYEPRIAGDGFKLIHESRQDIDRQHYSGIDDTVLGIGWKYESQATWQYAAFCISLHYTTMGMLALLVYYRLRLKYVLQSCAKYQCVKCGYDLRGTHFTTDDSTPDQSQPDNGGKRCPECGYISNLAVEVSMLDNLDHAPQSLIPHPFAWHRRLFIFMILGTAILIVLHIDSHWHTLEAGFQINRTQFTFNNENGMMIFSNVDVTKGNWESDMPIHFVIKPRRYYKGWNFKFDPGWDQYGFDYLDFWDTHTIFHNAIFTAWHISVIVIWCVLTLICGMTLRRRCLEHQKHSDAS
jgi:DNA-directed RNA polymerase subunit RPC12/RpoP